MAQLGDRLGNSLGNSTTNRLDNRTADRTGCRLVNRLGNWPVNSPMLDRVVRTTTTTGVELKLSPIQQVGVLEEESPEKQVERPRQPP